MLGKGTCSAVVGVLRSSGRITVAGTERAFCRVTVGRDVFDGAGSPCGLVAWVGKAILGSFAWSWVANDECDGNVVYSSPY